MYRKFPKYSDTQKICCNHSKMWTMWLCLRVMSPNDADRMANSVDPDHIAPLEVWSGSALFAQAYLSENLGSLRYCSSSLIYHKVFGQILIGLGKQRNVDQTAPRGAIWSGSTNQGQHCHSICIIWTHYSYVKSTIFNFLEWLQQLFHVSEFLAFFSVFLAVTVGRRSWQLTYGSVWDVCL